MKSKPKVKVPAKKVVIVVPVKKKPMKGKC